MERHPTLSSKWHFLALEDLMLLVAILPKIIYTINITLTKILGVCFGENSKLILNLYGNAREPVYSKP